MPDHPPAILAPAQLQALRRLLHYSAPEAARWVAADDERQTGVEERTWNRWEAGARPGPPNIAARLLELVAWRAQRLAELRQLAQHPQPLVLAWHDDADDWPEHGALRRPAQSAAAQLLAELGPARVQLAPFDATGFRAWRGAAAGRVTLRDHDAWAAAAARPGSPARA